MAEQSDNTCAVVLDNFRLFRLQVDNSNLCTRTGYGSMRRIELIEGNVHFSITDDITTGVGVIVLNGIRREIDFILLLQCHGVD